MKRTMWSGAIRTVVIAALAVCFGAAQCPGFIDTVTGPTFNLTAKADYISTPDGGSYLMWGYGIDAGRMQYTGPTLDVEQGDTVTVNLSNELTVPVSIVFPGQENVTATGDIAGALTAEAAAGGGTAQYSFVADHPGTYLYYSGTNPSLQVEMGLVGALIVRPADAPPGENWAYNHADSQYDYEYLFLLTEMDPTGSRT